MAIRIRVSTGMAGHALLLGGVACVGAGFGASALAGGIPAVQPAASEPLADLTAGQLSDFFVGETAYTTDLTELQGLGPIFNQTACGDCHLNPNGATGTQKVLRGGMTGKAGFDPMEEFGGSLFQLEAISDDCREDFFGNTSSDRVTNGMLGYGLVEAILDADIQFLADNPPNNRISGVRTLVDVFEDAPNQRIGRFGWKAQVATVLTFSSDAALQEMGLTNRFLDMDNDPNGINPPSLGAPDNCDTVADPEDSVALGNGVDKEFIDVVTDFQRFLAQPPQTPKTGMSGETIFNNIGCADCHHPEYTTDASMSVEEVLRGKVIRPYSDFLLHDMGPSTGSVTNGGGDGIPQGSLPNEIKTPPLWGVALRPAMWHDGRFESGTLEDRLNASIVAHDEGFGISEGTNAADEYALLSQNDKDLLIKFLSSLGRREFDQNRDNAVTIFDFHGFGAADAFKNCFGPGPYTADDDCAIHDVDADGDVDQDDLLGFLSVYEGYLGDCNENGQLDLAEIAKGSLTDANDDGVPDECEPTCLGDTNGDGVVDTPDFLALLGDWGPCDPIPAPCPSDLNTDGVVDTIDFLQLLSRWGVCP